MRRLVVVLGCVLAGSGCVFVVGSPLSLSHGRDRAPLEGSRGRRRGPRQGSGHRRLRHDHRHAEPPALGLVEEDSTLARIEAELDAAKDDHRIKAVVVYIRSPGGGVTASDDVYRALLRFKEKQQVPMVAALGGVAAQVATTWPAPPTASSHIPPRHGIDRRHHDEPQRRRVDAQDRGRGRDREGGPLQEPHVAAQEAGSGGPRDRAEDRRFAARALQGRGARSRATWTRRS
jgi:hypothetical protein